MLAVSFLSCFFRFALSSSVLIPKKGWKIKSCVSIRDKRRKRYNRIKKNIVSTSLVTKQDLQYQKKKNLPCYTAHISTKYINKMKFWQCPQLNSCRNSFNLLKRFDDNVASRDKRKTRGRNKEKGPPTFCCINLVQNIIPLLGIE